MLLGIRVVDTLHCCLGGSGFFFSFYSSCWPAASQRCCVTVPVSCFWLTSFALVRFSSWFYLHHSPRTQRSSREAFLLMLCLGFGLFFFCVTLNLHGSKNTFDRHRFSDGPRRLRPRPAAQLWAHQIIRACARSSGLNVCCHADSHASNTRLSILLFTSLLRLLPRNPLIQRHRRRTSFTGRIRKWKNPGNTNKSVF